MIVCLLLAVIFIVLVVVLAIRFKREYHNAAQQVADPLFPIIPGDYTGLFLLNSVVFVTGGTGAYTSVFVLHERQLCN